MSTTPLSTDFKDDILASANPKRKYQMIYNDDGSVSFTDVTQYDQTGSIFGAKEVNEERAAINNIDERRLVTLDEIDLVTEEGYFVDAKAAAELNRKLPKVEKNSDGNDIIDTGYSKIAAGTMVTNAIIDSKSQSYAQVFSADQIKRKLNLDTFEFSKFSIDVYNGDPNAAYTHLYNVEWWSGIGAYFVYMYPNITGSVRINYRIEYFYM